ncbi:MULTISPECIES: helix-turn-helix transcriptional regulator [unclassified Streptomyces]|uniref:helix-turn-helix domain-containing protein n=1 Tax=unclassified Streptomyces TaxID=2593676 RepID=UPI00081EDB8D|nr:MULTISPECIES: helix-turn-helix transcriptional regulator [unclassified Streptomyces]SCF26947.1 RNA polymerase primary sigma factor [Streptomyces sp. LcepLS]
MATSFGDWLNDQLAQRGMTQRELAEAVEVTPAAVNAWTKGRSVPRMDKIQRVAEAFGVPTVDAVERRAPQVGSGEAEWVFQPAPADGSRSGGNAAAFAFTADLGVLAREATQNSLDEQLSVREPVLSRYVLHELSGLPLRRFLDALRWDALRPHLRAAADRSQKSGRVLADGLGELERTDRLHLLRVDDYNANGLTGPEYDDGRFARVVRRTLDSGKAGVQGGSYGMGKATLWAASRFGLVLVNSVLSEQQDGRTDRRLAGRLELPWHALPEEREYAGPAWFGIRDQERGDSVRSWWADSAAARELLLERESDLPGTSFLVVGAYDGSGVSAELDEMHACLMKELGDNFWAAMVAGENRPALLRATVEAWRNGEVVVPRTEVDPFTAAPAKSRAVKAFLDGETVSRLSARTDVVAARVPLELVRRKDDPAAGPAGVHEAVLLVTPAAGAEEPADRLTMMRATRMVVKQKRVGDLPLGHTNFQAVLLAGAATGRSTPDVTAAELLLRASEPPEHNDWTGTDDLTATYVRGARKRVLDFKTAAEQAIRDLLRVEIPDDDAEEGPAVLRELLVLEAPARAGRPVRVSGFPTVRSLTGGVSAAGAWRVEVMVRLPEREAPWVLAPTASFVNQDGGRTPVSWAGVLVPGSNCELTADGHLSFTAGARTAVFRGVTDPRSHPVPARVSSLQVELPRAQAARGVQS